MEKFDHIHHRAVERKGSEAALKSLLSSSIPATLIGQIPDDIWLEEFTRKVFQSAFYWSIIEKKWPGFKEVFWDFNIDKLLMMPHEMLEKKASDPRIVRNYTKVKTIPANAQMIHTVSTEQGSFGQFIADWPSDNIIGLWGWLKQNGSRLGGNTGPYALRALGKDTFILSRDVESYLRANNIIDGGLQSKKSLNAIQSFFNDMQQQSGLSLQHISQTISYSTGDNRVGFST
ncbi:MAG: 3-methyladenine DNA glycosylase Tag [Phenylobacterium sp.]